MKDRHIRYICGLKVLKNSHPAIRHLKRTSSGATIHGNKYWNSTSIMMDYLQTVEIPKGCRVLEIGAGWGLSGIYCAKYLEAKVTALDADQAVFPYLQHHTQLNNVTIDTLLMRFEQVSTTTLSQFDLIIGADICFWDEMSNAVYHLLDCAYQAGVQRVILTDPGRQPFRDMAARCTEKYQCMYDQWLVPHPYNLTGLVLDIA